MLLNTRFPLVFARAAVIAALLGTTSLLCAQHASAVGEDQSGLLPDAPTPVLMASTEAMQQNGPVPQASSSSIADGSQHNTADEQLKEQKQQRVLGILPSFNISYRSDAVSLTGKQKINLAFHSATDPVTFAAALVMAGYHEARDDNKGFGWGAEGYGKRAGAAYLDSFDGTMIGNGILPAVLHQDPRYFRLGHGSVSHRLLYAFAMTVVCKHDNTGKWEPNYSNIAGNIAAGGISNLYYPSDGSGAGQAFSNGIVVTVEGGLGGVFQEFWPDISRKFLHKDPTHGLDAQAARQQAK